MRGPEGRSSWLAKGSWLVGRINQEKVKWAFQCTAGWPHLCPGCTLFYGKLFVFLLSGFFLLAQRKGKAPSGKLLHQIVEEAWVPWCVFVVGKARTDWTAHFLCGGERGSPTVYSQGRKCPRETWRWRKHLLREHQSDPGQLAWRLWQPATARIWRWEAMSLLDQPSVLLPPSCHFKAQGPQKGSSVVWSKGAGESPRVFSNPVSASPLLVTLYVSYLDSLSLSFLTCSVTVWTVFAS